MSALVVKLTSDMKSVFSDCAQNTEMAVSETTEARDAAGSDGDNF